MGLFSRKKSEKNEDKLIYSPVNGKLKELSSLSDGVFSEKMLGNGFVVSWYDGKVYSPINGELVTVFPTGHAYGIKTKDGLAVLVHIGIDTVNLNGKGFDSKVKQGDKVKKGDLLCEVDLNLVKESGYNSDVIVVVTNDSTLQPDEKSIKTLGDVRISDVVIDNFLS